MVVKWRRESGKWVVWRWLKLSRSFLWPLATAQLVSEYGEREREGWGGVDEVEEEEYVMTN